MNINEIKSGNYYTNGHGVYVMASGAVQDNEFQATNIELGQVRMYPISEFSHTTFHEAFRDNVNRIVLEAVTSQNKESLYDHTGKIALAVSDFQKEWILKHYALKSGNVYSESYVKNLLNNIHELEELRSSQALELRSLKEKALKNEHIHNDSVWYIGELKKFIQHLQDYISAKHLESEGLILEKFIQEESDAKKSS